DEMIAYVRWIGAYECPTCIAFPTQRTATGRLVWDEAPGTLSDADKVNLRAKFADHFDTLRPGMAADPELRLAIDAIQQDATLSSPIYSGYWKNLGLVMIFGALLRSLRWVTDSLHGHRTEAIREFRLAYDQCPGCAYDIRGLPNHRCPECGATWTYHELEMAREKRSRNTE
ncbi:MAG TPA: hypothetical protein VG797_07660, partial [Phycisphaerales bacterium]|nr:hypothetical protein [Phycisphaerales bacterium]